MAQMMEPRIMQPGYRNPFVEHPDQRSNDVFQRRSEPPRSETSSIQGLAHNKVAPEPTNDCENGKPKILSKFKFSDVYALLAGLKYVVVQPFNPDLFLYPVFANETKKALEYAIHSAKDPADSVCMLRFATMEEGESSKAALSGMDNVTVSHPVFDRNQSYSKGNHVILDSKSTGLKTLMTRLYWKEENEDTFVDRSVMIEHVPQCRSDELPGIFPGAENIINYTLDSNIGDAVIVEYKRASDAEACIRKYHGSTIKGRQVCAHPMLDRLSKIMNHCNKYGKKKQEVTTLSDRARLQKIEEFIAMQKEKDAMVNRTDINGYEKEYCFHKLEAQWYPLQKALFSDAKRRIDDEIPLPENPENIPEDMQRNIFGKGVLDKRDEHRNRAKKKIEDRRKKLEDDIDAINRKKRNGKILEPRPKNIEIDSDPAPKRAFGKSRFEEPPQKKGPGNEIANRVPSLLDVDNRVPSLLDVDISSPQQRRDQGYQPKSRRNRPPKHLRDNYRRENDGQTNMPPHASQGHEGQSDRPLYASQGNSREFERQAVRPLFATQGNSQEYERQPDRAPYATQGNSRDYDRQSSAPESYRTKPPEALDFRHAQSSYRGGYAPTLEPPQSTTGGEGSMYTHVNSGEDRPKSLLADPTPPSGRMMIPRLL